MSSPASTLRPGDQLASTVCSTKVVVVRAPAEGAPVITCGGSPMAPASSVKETSSSGRGAGTLLGKRYVDAHQTLELLCTSAGSGELSCDGVPMTLKAAKPLPASD